MYVESVAPECPGESKGGGLAQFFHKIKNIRNWKKTRWLETDSLILPSVKTEQIPIKLVQCISIIAYCVGFEKLEIWIRCGLSLGRQRPQSRARPQVNSQGQEHRPVAATSSSSSGTEKAEDDQRVTQTFFPLLEAKTNLHWTGYISWSFF